MSGTNGTQSDLERTIQLWGGEIVFRTSSESVDIAELTAGAGFAPTPHVHHRHHERFYVLDGCFDFLVGDEVVRLGQGGSVDVPPGLVHDFFNPGPGTARLLGIATPGGLERYFLDVEEHILQGRLDEAALAGLRVAYDTENVPLIWRAEPSRAEG